MLLLLLLLLLILLALPPLRLLAAAATAAAAASVGVFTKTPSPSCQPSSTHGQVHALQHEAGLVSDNLLVDRNLLKSVRVHKVVHVALQVRELQVQLVHLREGDWLALDEERAETISRKATAVAAQGGGGDRRKKAKRVKTSTGV